jgi:hypothetical protein
LDNYLIQATGTGNVVSVSGTASMLIFPSNPFLSTTGNSMAGLTFGGQPVTSANVSGSGDFTFVVGALLDAGSANSFGAIDYNGNCRP